MTDDLRALARVVHTISGVVVGDGQLASLVAALGRVDPSLTPAGVLQNLDPAQLERLVDEVAVKETFFLRHPEELQCIDWRAKAARATAAGRPLRIWSAGCSTGEEAYSLALLALESLRDAPVGIDVLGSDLSSTALAVAERGLYGTRSTRLVDDARRARWFVPDGDRELAGPDLRRRVRFARHNLIRDPFPPAGEAPFDLIVCRNVLIYFDAPTVARVTAALRTALTPDGRLLLGTVDRLGGAPPTAVATAPQPTAAKLDAPILHPGKAPIEWSAGVAHAAFETGSRALSAGDATAAVSALRRALYLDPQRAVVALQLARAHEALDDVDAARHTYRQALSLVDDASDPRAPLYDHIAAGDVAAACRARLAVLPEQSTRSSPW